MGCCYFVLFCRSLLLHHFLSFFAFIRNNFIVSFSGHIFIQTKFLGIPTHFQSTLNTNAFLRMRLGPGQWAPRKFNGNLKAALSIVSSSTSLQASTTRTKREEEKGEEQMNHIRIESRTYYHFQKLSLNYKSFIFFSLLLPVVFVRPFSVRHTKFMERPVDENEQKRKSMWVTKYLNSTMDHNINSYFIALFSGDECAEMRMCCSDFDTECWMINNNNTQFCYSLLLKTQRALQVEQITLVVSAPRYRFATFIWSQWRSAWKMRRCSYSKRLTGFRIRAHFRRREYSRSLLLISIQSSVNLNAIKYYMQTNLLFNGKRTNRSLYLSFVFYVWIKRAQACNGCHAIASIEQHTADASSHYGHRRCLPPPQMMICYAIFVRYPCARATHSHTEIF